jgi:N-acetylglucosaminyldiphosphoundecaprenol N-acetyl-beta-D-mannosaminyltransferase
MEKCFKIQFEFDHKKFENIIDETSLINKGYCCFIDSNTLVESHRKKNAGLLEILNNALANSCDGRYVALLASKVYKKNFQAYSGPNFFRKFIFRDVRQCIIGNTHEVFEKINEKVKQEGHNPDLHFIPLPFVDINKFDYLDIARHINTIKPRYIWVSLGAPKQEIFMANLLPHINSGVMLGVGAALNYFSGTITAIPNWAEKYSLIWFFRILTEPNKQIRRVAKILRYYPTIFF